MLAFTIPTQHPPQGKSILHRWCDIQPWLVNSTMKISSTTYLDLNGNMPAEVRKESTKMTICLNALVAMVYLEQCVGWKNKVTLGSSQSPRPREWLKVEDTKLNSQSYLEGAF